MRVISCNTAILGAGCAGLNAADELKRSGVDAHLFCDELGGGVSFNAGSDKQTYFKTGLADSVDDMTRVLFGAGGMHGDHARCMAALSARCFYKLVQLGVPFPHNEWGEYVGYRTDHDASLRATSAGPLTSRMMGEALMSSVRARGVPVTEGVRPVALLDGGALLTTRTGETVLVNAPNVILCTGGPKRVYGDTVYPARQEGATGVALRAGAVAANLCYWQYGLASVGVRWNVSGSYQQALPRYIDENGRDILAGAFSSDADMLENVFLKGYQWPFDARKADGSTRVDMAVRRARDEGRRVFLDFRHDAAPISALPDGEAREYLARCGALREAPVSRLRAVNEGAYQFYRERGIDLAKEPLEISICAQHCNGGLQIDAWWRTSLPGVYAAGECAGAFGITRPGGSALNETQVGSLRAAQHIAAHGGLSAPPPEAEFLCKNAARIAEEERAMHSAMRGQGGAWTAATLLRKAQDAMDRHAGAMRDVGAMRDAMRDVENALRLINTPPAKPQGAWDFCALRDVLETQRAALAAMCLQAECAGEATHGVTGARETRKENIRDIVIESSGGKAWAVKTRPIPEGGGWFEKVWRAYQDKEVFG